MNADATPNPEPVRAGARHADLALTDQPLSIDPPPATRQHGACIQFYGIVRDAEGTRQITGIDYRAYPPMAEAKLRDIAQEGEEIFEEHTLKLHHRIGLVPVAEPSVIIRVTTRHSQAAFDICQHYLRRLKTEIPIWKHPVPADED
jgi:molybdopterin synthase catalytic subunit